MSFEQMKRDGISRIKTWTKPKRAIGCTVQFPIERPMCVGTGCHKKAGYNTPKGTCCFDHAIMQASS